MSRRPLGDYSAYLRDLGDVSHARIYASWGPALLQLSRAARGAVVALALLCKGLAGEEGGEASYNEIAAHAGWGRRSMVAAIKELEEKGWLEIERHRSDGKGWRISNRYLLIPPISPPVKAKRSPGKPAAAPPPPAAAAAPAPAAAAPADPKDPARALAEEWYRDNHPDRQPVQHEIQRLRRYIRAYGYQDTRDRLVAAIRKAKGWKPEQLGGLLSENYMGSLPFHVADDRPENRQDRRTWEEEGSAAPVQEWGLQELDRSENDRSRAGAVELGNQAAQLAAEERLRILRPLVLELAAELRGLPEPAAVLRPTKRTLILGERSGLIQELEEAAEAALAGADAINQALRMDRLVDVAQAHLQRHRTIG